MKYLRWVLIFAIVALAVYHLKPHFADFKQFPQTLKSANYLLLIASSLGIIVQYFADGWLSKALLQITGFKIGLKKTTQIAAMDVFAAHVLPIGQAGVVATAAYFYKKLGVANQAIVFLTIAWGVTTTAVLIIFLLASLFALPKLPNLPIHITSIVKIVLIAILATIFIIIIVRKIIFNFLEKKYKNNKIKQ